MVGRVERAQLRGADRRSVRDGCDRLLLQRGRNGLESARPAAPKPHRDDPRSRSAALARRLPRHPYVVAARLAATARTKTTLGPDPLRGGPHVRQASCALPRDRRTTHTARTRHLGRAGDRSRRLWPARCGHHRRVGRSTRPAGRRGRHDAHPARAHARPGGDRLRSRPDRRGPSDRPAAGVPRRDPEAPPTHGSSRLRRRRVRCPRCDCDSGSRRRLARRSLVAARTGRRARGTSGARGTSAQRGARPPSLASSRLAGRCRRGAGACGRPVPGRHPHCPDGHAARAAQHRRGSRVRARHAVRRAHDGVCLLRLESPERARAESRRATSCLRRSS